MKKVVLFFAMILGSAIMLFAQEPDVVESGKTFLELLTGIVVPIAVLVLGYFKVVDWFKAGKGAQKTADVLEKVAIGMDSLAVIAQGAGFEKVSTFLKEGADIPDEAGDVAQFIADHTADGAFDKDEALGALAEFKEVIVELKDFRIKVFPKKK